MLTTTLNRILACSLGADEWAKLLAGLGKTQPDDEPLPYATILRINGYDDAMWAMRCEPQHAREWRLFAVWCVRQIQDLLTDCGSLRALDVAERYARGEATDYELFVANDAARDAAGSAEWNAPEAAAEAVTWKSAWKGAEAAAYLAADAVEMEDAARDAQAAEFLRVVGGEP